MIKIVIFSDSYKHFKESIGEYEKRLKKEVRVIKLKPSKRESVSEIIKEETLLLKEKLKSTRGYKILLSIKGKALSTEELYKLIEKKSQEFQDIVFIVGGVYGVDLDVIEDVVDFKLSISNMTFPHNLAYLILLEQLYRVLAIKNQTPYHH